MITLVKPTTFTVANTVFVRTAMWYLELHSSAPIDEWRKLANCLIQQKLWMKSLLRTFLILRYNNHLCLMGWEEETSHWRWNIAPHQCTR